MTVAEASTDGRTLRSSRTRVAIVSAHRQLLLRGELSPTTGRIAEAAGISPRTLFLHFNDLESLFAATADSVIEDVLARTRAVDPSLPFSERVDAFLANRLDLYEFLEPFVLALQIREARSPALRERRSALMTASRTEIALTFTGEVSGCEDALLSLETCVSWPSWFHLHEELGLPRTKVLRVLRRSVVRLAAP